MNENNQNTEKRSPFVRLENCGAIISDIDYNSNGRLSYMPYSGVNNSEGKNKVVSTPDPYSAALTYTTWCNDIIAKQLLNIPAELTVEFAKAILGNVDYIINNRLKYEIATAVLTIFNANTRAIMLPYIINPDLELDNYRLFMHTAQGFYIDRLFEKDNFAKDPDDFGYQNRINKYNDDNELNKYCVGVDEAMVKALRIISFLSADISNIYSRYIYNTLQAMDIERFANDSINSLGINRSLVSTDNDLPYVSSILNEAAYNDVKKITEIVELLVNHSYYVFTNLYMSIISKTPKQMQLLVDTTPNRQPAIDGIPYTNPKGLTNNIMFNEYMNN
jgi:hypothetical protein